MKSIGSVLDETKGIGQGFDFLRIFLSFCILCWHSAETAYGYAISDKLWTTPAGAVAGALLPVFFALSGFLVMGSALRVRSLTTFITFRALRILPALSTDVLIAAILIGGSVTALPVAHYYTSTGFFSYFLNIFGHIEFRLPGVFETNPNQIVNGSLWTIPPEIFCYLFLALMMLSGSYMHRRLYTAIVIGLAALLFFLDATSNRGDYQGHVEQYHLFLSFAFGNLLYHYRYAVPRSFALFVVCLAAGLAFIRSPLEVEISLVALTYCVVYLGTLRIPKLPLLSRGDYSYGVYLYGYPIQQLITLLFPELRTWYFNILIAAPLSLGCAMLSWHFIEAPTLKLKERFRSLAKVESRYLDSLPIGLGIALLIVAYGIALMHWSGIEVSAGINFRAQWKETVLVVALLGTLAVWGRRLALRPRAAEVAP
jgi:peptidoglycan/LPS O-acetylase OafA/YrhL